MAQGVDVDQRLMARAIELARSGMGAVAPNPLVGAVLARDGQILSEGYHAVYGESHAERAALDRARQNGVDTQGATLYVTLEPCNHQGKTPPCTEAILEAKLARVVVAGLDPNPQMSGQSVELLRQAGIDVEVGLLREEAERMNRRYITYRTRRRPYVVLKWAQTLDGYIDAERAPGGLPVWITNQHAQTLVHKWRSEEGALMVGTNTVVRDNPYLNIRYWHGTNPLRVVLDRTLRIPPECHVFDGTIPTMVFAGNNQSASKKADQIAGIKGLDLQLVDFMKGIENVVLEKLYEKQITSIMVEGGGLLLSNFLKRDLWDEARVFIGNRIFRGGVPAPPMPVCTSRFEQVGDAQLHTFINPTPLSL